MCSFCLARQCPWNYLGIECSSEHRKKPKQKQDHCHHFYHTHQVRSCCKSLLFHRDPGRDWEGVKTPWVHPAFFIPWLWCAGSVPTTVGGYSESTESQKCCTSGLAGPSHLHLAQHQEEMVCYRLMSLPGVCSCATKSYTTAMKSALFWRLTYLTYTGMWVTWR